MSNATYYRKYGLSGLFMKVAKDFSLIIQYFVKKNEMENTETKSNYTEIESNFDINDDKEDEDKKDKESEDKEDKKDDFTLRMQELEKVLNQNKKKLSTYDYLRHRLIHEFFINLKKESMTHKDTALNVAKKIYNEGPWKARIIRKWAKG